MAPEHGKAVYRALGEGRWVVTASGNGSLGLVRADDTEAGEIAPPVTLKDFEAEIKQADASVDSIGLGDVWRAAGWSIDKHLCGLFYCVKLALGSTEPGEARPRCR